MKNFINKLFQKGGKGKKIDTIVEKLEKAVIKVNELTEKVGRSLDENMLQLNPNRRFVLEKGDDGFNHTTYIAIRDRQHATYLSHRNDVICEDKNVVFYADSKCTISYNGFKSYSTPSENIRKAEEAEMHLDALEKLGVLKYFNVNK